MENLPDQQIPDLEKKWDRMEPPTPIKVGGSVSFWKVKILFQKVKKLFKK